MNIVTQILQVFNQMGEWMVSSMKSFMGLFYEAETGLTIFGTLAVVALGISVVLLVFRLIQNFLHLRG